MSLTIQWSAGVLTGEVPASSRHLSLANKYEAPVRTRALRLDGMMARPLPQPGGMPEQLKGCRVKGGMVRAHLDWLRRNESEGAFAKVFTLLPLATASEVQSALSSSWVAFESLILLDRAISRVAGGGFNMRQLGRFSAHQNLSTTYRLFRRADIHDFFQRSAALHDQFQDFGREEYVVVSERAGRIVHREYACFSADYCESAAGYYEEVITMHGGEKSAVEHAQCVARGAAECIFDLSW